MKLRSGILSVGLALVAWPGTSNAVPEYGCPRKPTWDAVPCSMYDTLRPSDAASHDVTFVPTDNGHRIYRVTAGPTEATLHVYSHFERPDWVARQVAKAWSAQPTALRRATMPLIIGIDRAGPVYWDNRDSSDASHIIEYPASYVHESARTLDWSFEELLTHELCHALDKTFGMRDLEGWQHAVANDGGRFVTDYASSSNGEDFAESCTVYWLMRTSPRITAEHRRHVEATMPHRLAWLSTAIEQRVSKTVLSWHAISPKRSGATGFLRLTNLMERAGTVDLRVIDERGDEYPLVTIRLQGHQTRALRFADLAEEIGDTSGAWLIHGDTALDVRSAAYAYGPGWLAQTDLTVPGTKSAGPPDVWIYRPHFLNPASNMAKRSVLRLFNTMSTEGATVTLIAHDDAGEESEHAVEVLVPAGYAPTIVTAQHLEEAGWGDGRGKWRPEIQSPVAIHVIHVIHGHDGYIASIP